MNGHVSITSLAIPIKENSLIPARLVLRNFLWWLCNQVYISKDKLNFTNCIFACINRIGFDYLKNHNLEQPKSYGKITRKTSRHNDCQCLYVLCAIALLQHWKTFLWFPTLNATWLSAIGVSIHASPDSDSSTTKVLTQSNFKHKSQYNTMHPHAQTHQSNMQRWVP